MGIPTDIVNSSILHYVSKTKTAHYRVPFHFGGATQTAASRLSISSILHYVSKTKTAHYRVPFSFWRRHPDGGKPPIDQFDSALRVQNKNGTLSCTVFILEAPPRIELGNKGFADLCLTAWLWRLIEKAVTFRNSFHFCGADYEARTRYLHLGKVALYQMS